nr:hypothetical protein [Chloroflexaceae bacterium]
MAQDTLKKPPTLAAQVSRAVFWNALFVPLRALAELVATLVKLNYLPQASFGLLALVSGATSGFGTAIDLGTTRALPKYIPETSRAGGPRAVLRLLAVVFGAQGLGLLAVGLGLAIWHTPYFAYLREQVINDASVRAGEQLRLAAFVNDYGWLLIAVILALLFLGICYDMCMAYLNSFFKQRAWNIIALLAGLLPPLLSAVAILLLRDTSWELLLGVLAAMVLAPTIAVALAGWQVARLTIDDLRFSIARAPEPESNIPNPILLASEPAQDLSVPSPKSKIQNLKSKIPPGFIRYCGVSFLMTLTDFIASPAFAIFLATGLGEVAVLWAGASVVKMVLGYLYTPMVGVQVPLFTRVRAGEGGTVNGAYQSLVRLQVLLLIPGGVGLMLLAEPALAVLAPNYQNAAWVVWVLVPCLFLECLLTTAHNALIVYEKLRIIIISRLLTLAVVVPLALLLPPTFGLVGVALAFG